MSFSLTQRSHMPKMSQICEELRVLEGHKHTYPNSFIYKDNKKARSKLYQPPCRVAGSSGAQRSPTPWRTRIKLGPLLGNSSTISHSCLLMKGEHIQIEPPIFEAGALNVAEATAVFCRNQNVRACSSHDCDRMRSFLQNSHQNAQFTLQPFSQTRCILCWNFFATNLR